MVGLFMTARPSHTFCCLPNRFGVTAKDVIFRAGHVLPLLANTADNSLCHPIFTPLKLLSLIFAFYILLLSAAPCCMADECTEEYEQTHSEADDCKDEKETNKTCHPFTICGSCPGFTISTGVQTLETPVFLNKPVYTGFIPFYFPQMLSSFWQPPKLAA